MLLGVVLHILLGGHIPKIDLRINTIYSTCDVNVGAISQQQYHHLQAPSFAKVSDE